jgi:hypothetical protein
MQFIITIRGTPDTLQLQISALCSCYAGTLESTRLTWPASSISFIQNHSDTSRAQIK